MLGNSVGELARFDLRTEGVLNQYKGFGGAVTAVQVCRDGSQLAACGLDRYLRVYCLKKPTLLHQVREGGRGGVLCESGDIPCRCT